MPKPLQHSKTKAAKFLEKVLRYKLRKKKWLNIMAEDIQFIKITESKRVWFITM